MSGVQCSIVIRAYNEAEHIGRLLEGITRQTIKAVEVILVDSGSSDDTVAIAKQYPVRVVSINPSQFTFGRSLNLGISAAQGEVVVMASAHVYPVYPDWLERLLAPFANPQIALVYGKQRGGATSQFSERQVFMKWYPEESQAPQLIPFCNNANAAIRRSLWEALPYNENLTGLEDLDWANRALKEGHALAYSAEAEVIHLHAETPPMVFNRYRREAIAFKRIFPEERFTFWNFMRLLSSNVSSDLWHAAGQRVLGTNLKSIFWFRTMQFWGTYQGYRHSGPLTWQLRQVFYYPPQRGTPANLALRNVEPIDYQQVGNK